MQVKWFIADTEDKDDSCTECNVVGWFYYVTQNAAQFKIYELFIRLW